MLEEKLPKNGEDGRDLAYFISLMEQKRDLAPQRWDQRAEFWHTERVRQRKGDERVVSARDYLLSRGLLKPTDTVADIGCGPGRFVADFARHAQYVVGLDISEKMIAYGREHLREAGVDNARLHVCDFDTLQIDEAGYRGAFDLVFSSMTPAIHSMDSLVKSMQMSRGWCCQITHLGGRNHLRARIAQEVFGITPAPRWTGRWFYALLNALFLMGYQPETSYENRHQELWVEPDAAYVAFLMEHMLPQEAITQENADKISAWLLAHCREDGLVQELVDTSYGRILWDVRQRENRPDYRLTPGGI